MPHVLEGLITQEDVARVAASETLKLDDKNRISVLSAMRSIDVQACPGSGKTTLIATKLILLAKKWPLMHQGVCVLSHTNVAKDEIVSRLKRSNTPESQRLLSYPHFIGTIQEFVGKFVAFPLVRSSGTSINTVDTDACIDLIRSRLQYGTLAYIDKKSQHSNVLYDFDADYTNGKFLINVPTFPNSSKSESYRDLRSVRLSLMKEGYFFYRDVFALASMALAENSALRYALRQRFQCVFLDEMQDTQKFQDELLQEIFPLDDSSCIIQRFGDPDQAIFQGIGNEQSNESFNGKSRDEMDFVLDKSHRFDNGLAHKIKHLSLNQISLASELNETMATERTKTCSLCGNFEHTIILFDDSTIGSVIEKFANLICEQFADHYRASSDLLVKVVGAVGNEVDPNKEQLKIGHYWANYDKSRSAKNFCEASLLEAVQHCRESASNDYAENHRFLNNCILKLLRMAESVDNSGKHYSSTSLLESLDKRGVLSDYCKCIYFLLSSNADIGEEDWGNFCSQLLRILAIENTPAKVTEYLSFTSEPNDSDYPSSYGRERQPTITSKENKFIHPDGFQIEMSTIHGVKGETHDATLVIETKNHIFDLECMLPFLLGELPSDEHPNSQLPEKPHSSRKFKPNRLFLRQFYVAMSRPKYLLCLALHSSRISEHARKSLQEIGWRIEILEHQPN